MEPETQATNISAPDANEDDVWWISEIDRIIAEIHRAFKGVSRTGGITLGEAAVESIYGSPAEKAEARELDTDTCWEDIPDEYLDGLHDGMYYLDSIGLRYYLPAFMVLALRDDYPDTHPNYFNSDVCERIEWYLQFDPSNTPHILERVSLLDEDQNRATCQYLRFVSYGEDDLAKLERYWGQFCNEPAD